MSKSESLRFAFEAAQRYIDGERSGSVGPNAQALAALSALGEVSLDDPIGTEAALALLDRVGSPATMRSTGGRYFGFVNGGVTPEALGASIVASAWDQNAALPAMSPVAAAADRVAAEWVVDVLGLPASATGAFCAGASVANLTAIVAARDALLDRAGWSVHDDGLAGAPAIEVIVSAETHISVHKALRIAGIGQAQVTVVPTNEWGALRASELPPSDGLTLAVLQAGNVNTGHSDPFGEVVDAIGGDDTWVHVDGAFGLSANAVPERRASVAGVERCDSWATDAHKWLNAPYDCAIVICADGRHLQRSMRADAAYLPIEAEERSSMNLGLQMSQRARAIPVWAILAANGRRGIADAIETTCQRAEQFAELLAEAGATVLVPVAINQVLVAFGDEAETNAVVEAVQADGTCWMGATTWQGRRAMRISVSDITTTAGDVEISVAAIVRCWHGLTGGRTT